MNKIFQPPIKFFKRNQQKTFVISIAVFLPMYILSGNLHSNQHLHQGYEGELTNREEAKLQAALKGPIAAGDPQLIRYVRERFLNPPSSQSYNLNLFEEQKEGHHGTSMYNMYRAIVISWVFLDKVLKILFKDEMPGFFVEAGALDGEYLSNTLDLEMIFNWKGLLVEADSDMFSNLQNKHRKAWTSNTCLAVHPYPHQTTLVKFTNHRIPKGGSSLPFRGFTALLESSDLQQRMNEGSAVYEAVQCLPLQTLLLALNVTHVQFFSLDVEGVEIEVLNTFWESGIIVDVWAVEHKHPNVTLGQRDQTDAIFIRWFESKGYTLYTVSISHPRDYIFIHNEASIYNKAFSSRPPEYNVF